MSWPVVLGLLLGACWVGALLYRRSSSGAESTSRPPTLVGAGLAYLETTFRIETPIQLVAKVDRAYRLPDGTLVLVELKTRRSHALRTTDVTQLSAQKLALEGSTGLRVARYAFVSTKRPTSASTLRHHRVHLLGTESVVALAHERDAVLVGGRAPGGQLPRNPVTPARSVRLVCIPVAMSNGPDLASKHAQKQSCPNAP